MRLAPLVLALAMIDATLAVAQNRGQAPPTNPAAPGRMQPPTGRGANPPANQPPAQQPPARGQTPATPPVATRGGAPQSTPANRAADETAIRQVIDAVTKAYNAHDAKAMGALFVEQGELVDEEGDVFQGREAVTALFDQVFLTYPQAKMTVKVERIRFLAPTLAVEEGATQIVHEPNAPTESSRYAVTYIKQDGKWQVASARDVADTQLRGANELEQLAWLVGEWVDESADALVRTSYRWDEKHKFIVGDFAVHVAGQTAMSGMQRIGWDPLSKQIRSWVFDSEGGFGDGLWHQDGPAWIVKYTGVSAAGEAGSATNVYLRRSPDSFAFESHDRVVAGEITDDTPLITVVRVPPKPEPEK